MWRRLVTYYGPAPAACTHSRTSASSPFVGWRRSRLNPRARTSFVSWPSGSKRRKSWKTSSPPALFHQPEGDDVRAGGHGNQLLVVERVRHGRGLPELAGLKAPQRLPRRGIGSHQCTAVFAEDHDSARGAQHTSP